MMLSESVLASFAPHLQLMLNPQARVLSDQPSNQQGDDLQQPVEVEGGRATVPEFHELPAAPSLDANDGGRADE